METTSADKLLAGLHEKRQRHHGRPLLYRVVFALLGGLLTLGGVGLLVLPGPALLFLPIGLSMLALEFSWAERLLGYVVRRAHQAREQTDRLKSGHKVALVLLGLLAAAAAVYAAIRYDIPLLPV